MTREGSIRITKTDKLNALPKGIAYRDFLPSTHYYNAYNSGYNSRNRMGKLLFGKIVNEFLNMQMEKLLNGEVISFKGSAPIKMSLLQVRNLGITDEDRMNGIRLVIWSYNGQKLTQYTGSMTNKFKGRIMAKIKSGVIYKKRTRNATKHKILYS
jgi:hypothetical protein